MEKLGVVLFDCHIRKIYAVCRSIAWRYRKELPSYLTVEDLTQLAVLQVWLSLSKFDVSRSFESYIKKVAYNAVAGTIRRLKARKWNEIELDRILFYYEPETDSSLASRLREAIDSLPLGQRYIIDALYGANSLKMYEVAEELKLSRQSVSARKKKTIQHLQRKLRL